ncbi:Ig domain-containing protein [Paludibacterium purpuratum]|uniref:Uncharacterized protein n=1 Tax=Paludibacterium purpuratum TaxID=1144873 RepID=A0A4R7BCU0_9NEIS|nr:Ig domain-containing protein [Paludibacterium purpuratum]TDR82781.1 hypothetical protein DFP86_101170 [Paludibacterium purpuratum]
MSAGRMRQWALVLAGCLALSPAWSAPASAPTAALALAPSACLPGDAQLPGDPNCPGGIEALSLHRTALVALPAAKSGHPYLYRFQPSGGLPPYRFLEIGSGLPAGLSLSADGRVVGNTVQTGSWRFTLELRDQGDQVLRQRFTLRVIGPTVPKPAPEPKTIVDVPGERAQQPLPIADEIVTYLLGAEAISAIAPDAVPPAPVPDASAPAPAATAKKSNASQPRMPTALPPGLSSLDPDRPLPEDLDMLPPIALKPDAVPAKSAAKAPPVNYSVLSAGAAKQLQRLLLPLVGVEYLNRGLLLAALDDRVCRYAQALTRQAALDSRQAAPSDGQWRARCAEAWQTPVNHALLRADGRIAWQDLPLWLMPPPVRERLAAQAALHHAPYSTTAPIWQGSGCNCLLSARDGEVFGFFPGWHDPKLGLKVNFGLYEHIVTLAQPIDDDGHVALPQPSAEQLAFFDAANRFRTQLDLTLYRGDWRFLARLSPDELRARADRAASEARRLIDTPLARYFRRWQDKLPGMGGGQTLGDGLVLYLDQTPAVGSTDYSKFELFRDRLIRALIAELRQGERQYTLSLMIDGTDLLPRALLAGTSADAAPPGRWTVAQLADYLKLAEDPPPGDSASLPRNPYQSASKLSLKLLLMLPEPSSVSKKALRQYIDTVPALAGGQRVRFLRHILPLVSLGSTDAAQFNDDMLYFNDNFGGAALWPRPITLDAQSRQLDKSVRASILGGEPTENPVCDQVCNWRWEVRAVFALLALIAVVSLLLYLTSCRIRALGRPYQLYLLLAAIAPLLFGGLLLGCDPDLNTGTGAGKLSNILLIVVLVAVILSLLIPLLQPKVEKP